MAVYNKFEQFVEDLGKGVHQLHAAGHTLKVFLSNEQPLATDAVKADIAEINMANEANHGAGGADIENDYTEAAGTATLTGQDKTFLASGGAVGPFQFVPLYNDNPVAPADPLISWWDYGSELTLNDGDSFTVDFGASVFTLA